MNNFKGKKIDYCDGCGWKKEIVHIADNGNGYCRECMDEAKEHYDSHPGDMHGW